MRYLVTLHLSSYIAREVEAGNEEDAYGIAEREVEDMKAEEFAEEVRRNAEIWPEADTVEEVS